MKLSFATLFLCFALLAQSKVAPAPPAGVPAGAKIVDSSTWRWVDKSGKAWLYRTSPFGVMKTEEPKDGANARPDGVPAGATAIAADTWRAVDALGKTWLYKVTPAGLLKTEQPADFKPAAAPDTDAALELISAKDEGEVLRFSKPGPFGTYSWTRKKTELNADETAVWERVRKEKVAKK
ncbi:MAG: hypothetical protein FJW30_05170 [Acidobacteria bacterium]|nr:hypothetical protein [Acidobacteriota bacterium]